MLHRVDMRLVFEGLFCPYHIALVISLLYAYWYILRLTRANGNASKYEDLLVDGETILLALYVLTFFGLARSLMIGSHRLSVRSHVTAQI
jgi:hypothetical protein